MRESRNCMNTIPPVELPKSVDLDEMKASFQRHGYAVSRGLFSLAEVEEIKSAFTRIAQNGPIPGHFDQVSKDESGGDPLKEFPRVMHTHLFDDVSRRNLVHPGVLTCLRELMQDDVLAVQSMFYYKPPGSRGQAMHQDNFLPPGETANLCGRMDRDRRRRSRKRRHVSRRRYGRGGDRLPRNLSPNTLSRPRKERRPFPAR
jgi:hypothetical protein